MALPTISFNNKKAESGNRLLSRWVYNNSERSFSWAFTAQTGISKQVTIINTQAHKTIRKQFIIAAKKRV
jgi:hypothetical protein